MKRLNKKQRETNKRSSNFKSNTISLRWCFKDALKGKQGEHWKQKPAVKTVWHCQRHFTQEIFPIHLLKRKPNRTVSKHKWWRYSMRSHYLLESKYRKFSLKLNNKTNSNFKCKYHYSLDLIDSSCDIIYRQASADKQVTVNCELHLLNWFHATLMMEYCSLNSWYVGREAASIKLNL